MAEKAATRKSPFDLDFGKLDFSRFFDDLVGQHTARTYPPFGAMDVYAERGKAVIEVCLPGIDKKDIKVKIEDHVVIIEAEVGKIERQYISEEIKRQSVRREVKICGSSYDEDTVSSTYQNGLLRITISYKPAPKKEVEVR